MSSPYTVAALTCVGALATNSLNVATIITASGALTAPSLTAPAASNLVLKTPAGFATVVGGSTAAQAAGETILIRVAVPTTDFTLLTVTAAGSGSGANLVTVVPPSVFNSTVQSANLKVTTSRTFAGQGAYMSWNDDGSSGATFFSNQLGGGSPGGWRWQPVSALDVAGPVVMTLSQTGDLTVVGSSNSFAVNCGNVTSTARVSAQYARVIGGAVTDTAGAYMSWADKTYFLNRETTTGGWLWQGVDNAGVLQPTALSLTHAGALTTTAGISCTTLGATGTSTLATVNCDAVTSTARVSALYARVVGNATLDTAGGYMSYDDKSYFFNRETATGGFVWRGVNNAGVVQPIALSLTHAGELTATAGISCTTLGATARVSALAVLATGGAVTDTAGAYMSYSDKTYFLNRETTTGGWLWYGVNNTGVIQAEALSLSHAGALTAASRVTAPTTRATSSATFTGQGAYTSWNDDGSSGATYFSNQLGGGSPGGWRWQPVDVTNVASAPVMNLSQTGILTTTNGMEFTEGTYAGEVYAIQSATKYTWATLDTPEFKYIRLGYNLVRVTIVFTNVTWTYSPFLTSAVPVYFGGLPNFGRTIDFNTLTNNITGAGFSSWGTQYAQGAGKQFRISARTASGALAADNASVFLLYNEATLAVVDLESTVVNLQATFDYQLY